MQITSRVLTASALVLAACGALPTNNLDRSLPVPSKVYTDPAGFSMRIPETGFVQPYAGAKYPAATEGEIRGGAKIGDQPVTYLVNYSFLRLVPPYRPEMIVLAPKGHCDSGRPCDPLFTETKTDGDYAVTTQKWADTDGRTLVAVMVVRGHSLLKLVWWETSDQDMNPIASAMAASAVFEDTAANVTPTSSAPASGLPFTVSMTPRSAT